MPKIKSYEDWTPPKFLTGDADEIDLERVKLEFYTRESENHRYRDQIRGLKSQVSDLREQVEADGDDDDSGGEENAAPTKKGKDDDEVKGQGPSLTETRLKVALEKGLTYAQAMRLHGETAEEIEADADVYMEEHGIKSGNSKDDGDDGGDEASKGSQTPPSRQPRRGGVKSGSERDDGEEPSYYDPEKFLDQV